MQYREGKRRDEGRGERGEEEKGKEEYRRQFADFCYSRDGVLQLLISMLDAAAVRVVLHVFLYFATFI